MIDQVKGILLIWIKCYNISDSYETKPKSFVIGDDFCGIEASVNFCIIDAHFRQFSYQRTNLHAKLAWWIARSPQVNWMITFQISFSGRMGPFAKRSSSHVRACSRIVNLQKFLTSSLQCTFVAEGSGIARERWPGGSIAIADRSKIFRQKRLRSGMKVIDQYEWVIAEGFCCEDFTECHTIRMREFLPHVDNLHHQLYRLNAESYMIWRFKIVYTQNDNFDLPCNLLKQYLIPVELWVAL